MRKYLKIKSGVYFGSCCQVMCNRWLLMIPSCHFTVDTDPAHLIGCINTTARQRCWPFEGIKWGHCEPFRIQTEQNGSKTHVKSGCSFRFLNAFSSVLSYFESLFITGNHHWYCTCSDWTSVCDNTCRQKCEQHIYSNAHFVSLGGKWPRSHFLALGNRWDQSCSRDFRFAVLFI